MNKCGKCGTEFSEATFHVCGRPARDPLRGSPGEAGGFNQVPISGGRDVSALQLAGGGMPGGVGVQQREGQEGALQVEIQGEGEEIMSKQWGSGYRQGVREHGCKMKSFNNEPPELCQDAIMGWCWDSEGRDNTEFADVLKNVFGITDLHVLEKRILAVKRIAEAAENAA